MRNTIIQHLGKKYGKLICNTFLREEGSAIYYEFSCDCGNTTKRNIRDVLRSKHSNCGCNKKSELESFHKSIVGETNNYGLIITKVVGKVNNSLNVVFKCTCGNLKETSRTNFKKQKSCGCLKYNKSDLKVGELYKNYKIDYLNKAYAGVTCIICNTTRTIRQYAIINKTTNSCTCFSSDKSPNRDDRSMQSHYKRMIAKVKQRGKQEFELSYEQYKFLITSLCEYCGDSSLNEPYKRIGIDRVDSTKGYTRENCVSCCFRCNAAKNNMTLKDFKDHIIKIYNFIIK